jgi:glutamine synthetase
MTRVPLAQLEVPDYDLGIRGKLVRAEKLRKSGRAAFCTIVYGLDPVDGVADTPFSSAANGYPDAFAVPDESTRVELPWRPGTEAVLADLVDEHGAPLPESPRATLSRVTGGFESLGLSAVLGFEYECHVMHADDEILRRRDFSSLRPLGRVDNAYSLGRVAESTALLEEFVDRMDSVGVPIEACHSELGPGFFEYAIAPLPARAAADAAVRSRQYFRDLCAERGLLATFMAKLRIDTSGAGGHVHQSVERDGKNQFSDGQGGLSDLGRHYLGGLLATMADSTALLNPFMNSYKRLSAGFFVAERASWGWDNRNGACRVIHNARPAATRIEHRRPGADANPYLAAAAMLAGGLHGLSESIEPGPALEAGPDVGTRTGTAGQALPANLTDAVKAFQASEVMRKLLGERFVDCYAATRNAEVAAFAAWWASTITDWELSRYLEHL